MGKYYVFKNRKTFTKHSVKSEAMMFKKNGVILKQVEGSLNPWYCQIVKSDGTLIKKILTPKQVDLYLKIHFSGK